jgi:hypothetical protein
LKDWWTFFLPENCDLGSTFFGLENANKTKNLGVESGIRHIFIIDFRLMILDF